MTKTEMFPVERLQSQNFLTDIISFVLFSLTAGAMISTSFDLDTTVVAILEQNWEYVIGTSIPAFITFVMKVVTSIKEKTFSFAKILKSPNAITKFLVIVSGIFASLNVILPADMPQVLGDAILSGSLGSIVTAVIVTIINPIWHIIMDRRNEDDEAVTA